MSDDERDDIEEQLAVLEQQTIEALTRLSYRTATRLCRESCRKAKSERMLIPYLSALSRFCSAVSEFAPREGIDAAIEMIALLEDEDRARSFQPNLPEDEYEITKNWLTARAYRELASYTANVHGKNSEGMHQCIAGGLEVCRRAGDRDDMLMFREFAVEVYRCADDIEMALHFARESLNMQSGQDVSRRVASADDVATLLMLQGHLAEAAQAAMEGLSLCDEFHSPYMAKLNFIPMTLQILQLAGRDDLIELLPRVVAADAVVEPGEDVLRLPPFDECPSYTFKMDKVEFVAECRRGDFTAAIERMKVWDRKFRECEDLNNWFDTRLRLVAAHRMSDKWTQAEALARPLREAATKAHDWLTIRLLDRVMDRDVPPCPVPMTSDPTIGPFAVPARSAAAMGMSGSTDGEESPSRKNDTAQSEHKARDASGAEEQDSPDEDQELPFEERTIQFYERLGESGGDPDKLIPLVDEILAISPSSLEDPDEAARLLHVIRFASLMSPRSVEVWKWGEAVMKQHPQNATVISMFASLGSYLRQAATEIALRNTDDTELEFDPDSDPDEAPLSPDPFAGVDIDALIPKERIESLYRQSMEIDPQDASNFARAGNHHFENEAYGEAERCLSRSFRLERRHGQTALRLAEVYSRTDRPRDGLAVLDLALREGCDDPDVAWRAALGAYGLGQYESMLTYLAKFDTMRPDQPWVNHYRACGLLELGRPEESLAAVDREAEISPELGFANDLQRASALGALKRIPEFREALAKVLNVRLATVDCLTVSGLQRLLHQLWNSSPLDRNDPQHRQLEDRLLGCGLAPNELFDAYRNVEGNDDKDVRFYQCLVRQPLDETWRESHQALPSEEDWTSYDIVWGVLAEDEDEAKREVLSWQSRCWPQGASVVDLNQSDGEFRDAPGVVWQGYRGPTEMIEDDLDDFDDE